MELPYEGINTNNKYKYKETQILNKETHKEKVPRASCIGHPHTALSCQGLSEATLLTRLLLRDSFIKGIHAEHLQAPGWARGFTDRNETRSCLW